MKKKDYGDLKRMLLDEFMQDNPTDQEVDAFMTGMTWFEDAIYDDNIIEELNEFLPMRKENEYLRTQLAGLHKILDDNIEMKRLYEGMRNELYNIKHLSKQEIFKLKEEEEYRNITNEVKKLRLYRDLYYELLAYKWLAEHPATKEITPENP